MRQWTESTLVQVMACRLFGAKPLPEPMPPYCQLDPCKQTSGKFESKYKTFHSWKCTWKCRLPKWRPFCSGEDEFSIDWANIIDASRRPRQAKSWSGRFTGQWVAMLTFQTWIKSDFMSSMTFPSSSRGKIVSSSLNWKFNVPSSL